MALNDDFDQSWNDLVARETAIHDAKRAAYTGGADPLANYRNASHLAAIIDANDDQGGLPAMIIRMQEKLFRLAVATGARDYLKAGSIVEGFEDTCIDIAVIAKLCAIEAQRLRHDGATQPEEPQYTHYR